MKLSLEEKLTIAIKNTRNNVTEISKAQEKSKVIENKIIALKEENLRVLESIKEIQRAITDIQEKLTEPSIPEINNLESLINEKDDLTKQINSLKQEMSSILSSINEVSNCISLKQKEIDGNSSVILQSQRELDSLKQGGSNLLSLYGKNMPKCLSDIESYQRWSVKPVGPIGLYIKLKDPFWRKVINDLIANTLSNFLVFSIEDRQHLQKIFSKYDIKSTIYIVNISSSNFPLENTYTFPTALSILEVPCSSNIDFKSSS